jgi:hypothetical protein
MKTSHLLIKSVITFEYAGITPSFGTQSIILWHYSRPTLNGVSISFFDSDSSMSFLPPIINFVLNGYATGALFTR